MDKITQRLCASLFGTAAIIFAFAFLIRTASPAQADNGPQTTYSTGKYMMTMQALDAGPRISYYILVWDTETGRSKFYSGDIGGSGTMPAHESYDLPSSPL